MRFLDTSTSQRIPLMMEMVASLSRLSDPRDLLELCIGSLRRANRNQCYLELSTRGLRPGEYRISRLMTHDGVDHVPPSHWFEPQDHPIRTGGPIGAIIATPVPKAAHDLNLIADPGFGDELAPYRSLVAVPIFYDGAPATWVVLLDTDPDHFALEDLEELIVRANLVGAVANNLQTASQLFQANLRIQQEVEHIAEIQRALLPRQAPDLPGVTIAASYETFEQAGGDMYDFVPLGGAAVTRYRGNGVTGSNPYPVTPIPRPPVTSDAKWAILIGDVSGHGPSAAVVMAMFHAILHAYPHDPAGPGELLEHVNHHLCSKPIGDCFVTAFLGIYDPADGSLAYARAGHPPPLVAAPDQQVQSLDAVGNLPLGIFADTRYDQATIDLRGRTLLLYTDGISEALSPEGRWFGVEGLARSLQSAARDPHRLIRTLTHALSLHQGPQRPRDDQTAVAIHVL